MLCKLAFDVYNPLSKAVSQPLIILHGLFGSKQNSRTLASKLKAQGMQVYVLDQRNHGDSQHSAQHTYKLMAQDVAQFIKTNNIETPHVIGHSMGAKTAMALALLEPQLVDKIVAVDNAPLAHELSKDFSVYLEGMRACSSLRTGDQKKMLETIHPFCKDLSIAYFLLSNFKKINGKYVCRIPLDVIERSLPNIADFEVQGRCPNELMLVRGSTSPFVPESAIPKTKKLFPNTCVHTLNSGHWVIQEQPVKFLNLLTKFVNP